MYLLSLVECWWKLMVYIMFIGTVLWGTGVNIGAMGVGDGALSREFTHIIVSSNPLLSRYNKQTYVILSLYCKYSRLPPKKIGRFILILTSSIIFRRILKKNKAIEEACEKSIWRGCFLSIMALMVILLEITMNWFLDVVGFLCVPGFRSSLV